MPQHHIIIGDGVTAAEFATTRKCNPDDSITIIGRDVANLGRGIAYASAPADAPWRYAYLLNSPARSVDIDFADWINKNWDYMVEVMSGRTPNWLEAAKHYSDAGEFASLNAPREIFGDCYRTRVLKKIEALRNSSVKVTLVAAHATRIERDGTGITIHTEDLQQFRADSVDIATGGPYNKRFDGDDGTHAYPELFGNEYPIAEKLQTGGNLVCIGSGAASLDLLRFYQSIKPESQIDFAVISTTGKILRALRPPINFKPTPFTLNGTFSTADDFLKEVFEQQRMALEAGATLYETRVGLRSIFLDKGVTGYVPNLTEARKIARPLFKHFEGGTRDSIEDFHALEQQGRTQVIAGNVQGITHDADHAHVHYLDENMQAQTFKACVVVNCAGPGLENRFDDLTTNMINQGLINICDQSGGLLVGEHGQTTMQGVRYLGPAVTSIGDSVEPVPLYDAFRLRRAVQRFNS